MRNIWQDIRNSDKMKLKRLWKQWMRQTCSAMRYTTLKEIEKLSLSIKLLTEETLIPESLFERFHHIQNFGGRSDL